MNQTKLKSIDSLGLRIQNGNLFILDQTQLPHQEDWIQISHPDEMVDRIKSLSVRGAPLIGVAAALSLAKFLETGANESEFKSAAEKLRNSRPTAVNLMNAIDRVLQTSDPIQEAVQIFEEDVELCKKMADHGAPLIEDGDSILTHCNTGGLATVGIGTALGVIRKAHEDGKKIHVYVDETRPLLQGARLTTWELDRLQIPYTLICDHMSANLMRAKKIQRVFVGADRIARNGDFANKVGTYSAAALAKHHGVPFYTVAPYTTIDPNCPNGAAIPIEERNPSEVRQEWSPKDAPVWNPSFDVTPVSHLTGIVTDAGYWSQERLMESGIT